MHFSQVFPQENGKTSTFSTFELILLTKMTRLVQVLQPRGVFLTLFQTTLPKFINFLPRPEGVFFTDPLTFTSFWKFWHFFNTANKAGKWKTPKKWLFDPHSFTASRVFPCWRNLERQSDSKGPMGKMKSDVNTNKVDPKNDQKVNFFWHFLQHTAFRRHFDQKSHYFYLIFSEIC